MSSRNWGRNINYYFTLPFAHFPAKHLSWGSNVFQEQCYGLANRTRSDDFKNSAPREHKSQNSSGRRVCGIPQADRKHVLYKGLSSEIIRAGNGLRVSCTCTKTNKQKTNNKKRPPAHNSAQVNRSRRRNILICFEQFTVGAILRIKNNNKKPGHFRSNTTWLCYFISISSFDTISCINFMSKI